MKVKYLFMLICLGILLFSGCSSDNSASLLENQDSVFGRGVTKLPEYEKVKFHSQYITMDDGVNIAIDVLLPNGYNGEKSLPSIMVGARYWRSFKLIGDRPGVGPMGPREPIYDIFVRYGYAVILVDVRGSGASEGISKYPMSRREAKDLAHVANWICEQEWSNGKIGAYGISYEGSTAEMLASEAKKGQVIAIIPQEIEYNLYNSISHPGGVFNEQFIDQWHNTNIQLDNNIVPKEWGFTAGLFVKGVRPVDADSSGEMLAKAIAQHRDNSNVYEYCSNIEYRDDLFGNTGVTFDSMACYAYYDRIVANDVSIMGFGSWVDGTSANTVLHRYMNMDSVFQVGVIGAWSHNLKTHGSPFTEPEIDPNPEAIYIYTEMLNFFNKTMKNEENRFTDENILYYYTMNEEAWHSTNEFPVPGTENHRFYMSDDWRLRREAPDNENASDKYKIDYSVTSGENNRWRTQDGVVPVIYEDMILEDEKMLTYTSLPFDKDMELTGYPVVSLSIESDSEDGALFVFLEHISPDGISTYVTEGQFRMIHRKVKEAPYVSLIPYHSFYREDALAMVPGEITEITFGLEPTSVLIRKGDRFRISIGGHDASTFRRIPETGNPVISLYRNSIHCSYVDIPLFDPIIHDSI